ncbi:alkene reductase [Tistrella bauzanensis]|uniref:Alkene reductase n=1 Tax=Tistrella arctica TaxID=3133430 RepID=A0ABU9YMN1_9PROT
MTDQISDTRAISDTATLSDARLFRPVTLGSMTLANRVAMAPLTRSRAGSDGVPSPLAATYYAQRADAGLIVTEATNISAQGRGYAWTPGIYNDAQVAAWKQITDAVHARGGRIVLQLWHVGRISHSSLQPGHALPVAPSAIRADGQAFTETGFVPFETPRALDGDEIPGIIEDYRKASLNARAAGFDGVEVHGANGYLLEQFLRSSTNHRSDDWGGSIENRARLLLAATDVAIEVFGADRVGVRLSPVTPANDTGQDDDPAALYGYVAAELGRRNIAFIHVVEGATGGPRDNQPFDYAALKAAFGKPGWIVNNGYDRDSAIAAIDSGAADMVAFGRPFISNPDLVDRLRRAGPLAPLDRDTLYGGGAQGYIDYPTLSGSIAAA